MFISRTQLRELVESPVEPGVSIYMPTHRAIDFQQDPIRLKNLLGKAEEALAGNGMRPTTARDLLEPARKLLPDNLFWERQSEGLALFISPKMFRYYRLPRSFEEVVVVGRRFHIKPILPLFASDGLFYVLALSQKRVRILQCTRDSFRSVAPEGLPGMADAMNFDKFERRVQAHSTGKVPGRASILFHADGSAGYEDLKKDLKRYFKIIDDSLHDIFKEEQAPLVVAGVDYLHPLYREASTYANVLDEGVLGNADDWSDLDLHRKALTVVGPYFDQCRTGALKRYHQAGGTALASNQLRDIVAQAYDGRVYLLFLAVDKQAWGAFDPDKRMVAFHEAQQPGDEDLIDFAAAHTLLKKGGVYPMKSGELPDAEFAAAVLRY